MQSPPSVEPRKFTSFEQVRHSIPLVHEAVRTGMSYGDLVVAMANEREWMLKRILELESIAPKKIRLGDGKFAIWHCPDELIPESGA